MCKPLLASINSPRLCGHSVVLCVVATRVWFIRCFHTTKKILGDPGSSRGMFWAHPGGPNTIHKPQVWELLRLFPETSTKLYVHEFGFCRGFFSFNYRGRGVEAKRWRNSKKRDFLLILFPFLEISWNGLNNYLSHRLRVTNLRNLTVLILHTTTLLDHWKYKFICYNYILVIFVQIYLKFLYLPPNFLLLWFQPGVIQALKWTIQTLKLS